MLNKYYGLCLCRCYCYAHKYKERVSFLSQKQQKHRHHNWSKLARSLILMIYYYGHTLKHHHILTGYLRAHSLPIGIYYNFNNFWLFSCSTLSNLLTFSLSVCLFEWHFLNAALILSRSIQRVEPNELNESTDSFSFTLFIKWCDFCCRLFQMKRLRNRTVTSRLTDRNENKPIL